MLAVGPSALLAEGTSRERRSRRRRCSGDNHGPIDGVAAALLPARERLAVRRRHPLTQLRFPASAGAG
jgi:hypothetical protein